MMGPHCLGYWRWEESRAIYTTTQAGFSSEQRVLLSCGATPKSNFVMIQLENCGQGLTKLSKKEYVDNHTYTYAKRLQEYNMHSPSL